MKKGFTLIELLGVIVIIGLMAMIIIPEVNKTLKRGYDKSQEQTKKSIELAARNYATDGHKPTSTCYVTLEQLINGGYIDINLNDSNNSIFNNSWVLISKSGNKYTYTYKGNKSGVHECA